MSANEVGLVVLALGALMVRAHSLAYRDDFSALRQAASTPQGGQGIEVDSSGNAGVR